MSSAEIMGGSQALRYPEAALVNMYKGTMVTELCSGSIIAPRVVLTAGHCVYGFDGWDVTAPFNGNQKAHGSTGKTFDWNVQSMTVQPTLHDIGLVFLDKPVKVTPQQCPVLAQLPVQDNTSIVNIGRINNGTTSYGALFVGPQVSVSSEGPMGAFPYDYAAQDVIEQGDSGGPDEVPGTSPHQIVAVNSGLGGGTEVLARIDLVYDWIQQQVQSNGGGCDSPADAGGGSVDAGPEGGGDAGGVATGDDGGGNQDAGTASKQGGGGCRIVDGGQGSSGMLALLGVAGIAMIGARRRRQDQKDVVPSEQKSSGACA